MQSNFNIKIERKEDVNDKCQLLANRLNAVWDGGHPVAVSFKEWRDARTRSQNNLYWEWCGDIAKDFTERGSEQSKDDIHDVMRYKFLGVETHEVDGEKIRRLPSTTKLGKGQMAEYMGQVEAWAYDHGILLHVPGDNEYKSYREASQ